VGGIYDYQSRVHGLFAEFKRGNKKIVIKI
jgi:hypothetical protein